MLFRLSAKALLRSCKSLRLSRRAVTLALTGLLSCGAIGGGAVPANAAASVHLENQFTGTCMWNTIPYNQVGDQYILMSSCYDTQLEQWQIIQKSGYVEIVPAGYPGYCLDAVRGAYGVTTKKCLLNDLHQHWFEKNVAGVVNIFENSYTDQCLDGTFNPDYPQIKPCLTGDNHQLWY
jgi:hypothetical protein